MLATFDHTQFDPEALARSKGRSVSVLVPTRETASTITATVAAIDELRAVGLVDQLAVIDADSGDGTAGLAAAAGAEVHSESALMPELGPVQGKGDAMWRALSIARGEIVVYVDGDVHDFGPHYVTGLLGPLFESERTEFVKGFYRRPLAIGPVEIEDGGGRVTELAAKPMLEILIPELAAFRQPLAGECAARRTLLERIPFATGYGVEIAMLATVWRRVGLERMAQVGLGSKRNSHQELAQLHTMSREVIGALLSWLAADGRATPLPAAIPELGARPPLVEVSAAGTAG